MANKYFEDTELDLLFDRWIDGAPDSLNYEDQERWCEFVLMLLDKGIGVDRELIWPLVGNYVGEDNFSYYMDKADGMEMLYELLSKRDRIGCR